MRPAYSQQKEPRRAACSGSGFGSAIRTALLACALVSLLTASAASAQFGPPPANRAYYVSNTHGLLACAPYPDGCGDARAADAGGRTTWIFATPDGSGVSSSFPMLLRHDLPRGDGNSANRMVRAPVDYADDLAVREDGGAYLLSSGLVYRYGASGSPAGTFSVGAARRLAVAADGTVYTAQAAAGGEGIVRYASGGGAGAPFGSAGIDAADLDILGNGDVAVCDRSSRRVRVFSPGGVERGPWGTAGLVPGGEVACASGPGGTFFVLRPGSSSGDPYCPSNEPRLTEIGADGRVRREDPLAACAYADLLAVTSERVVLARPPCCRSLLGLRLDETPPLLRSLGGARYTNGVFGVGADAYDEGTGVYAIESALDGQPFQATSQLDLRGRHEGRYGYRARARDGAGLVSNVLSASIVFDRTRPRLASLWVGGRPRQRPRRGRGDLVFSRPLRPAFAVRASDNLAGVGNVELALRKIDRRRRCTWWSFVRRDFLKATRDQCSRPRFFEAPRHGGGWSYSPRRVFKLSNSASKFLLIGRAEDRAGNVSSTKRLTFRFKKARRGGG